MASRLEPAERRIDDRLADLPRRPASFGIRVMRRQERRTNAERRRRIDDLLARVTAAREEIVEAGLDAVQDTRAADEASRSSGRFTRTPKDDAPPSGVSSPDTRSDG